jgi:enoyl-CoA hydratase/carnithine racemase
MPYDAVDYRREGRICYITLNRPQVLNAANPRLLNDLRDALEEFDRDDEAWVAILAGAGRAFCVGFDVKEVFATHEPGAPFFAGEPVSLTKVENWKPVIAAVRGYALGYGMILASECDLIVAAEDAQFALSEPKRGSFAGPSVHRLIYWMPSKVATEMILTGESIDAPTAHRLGLVNRVVPNDQLLPAARELAERLLAAAPLSVREGVRVTRLATERTLDLLDGWVRYGRLDHTEDFKEATRAFTEKREPRWLAR